MISPKGPEVQVISRQIANAHTSFNIVMTLIWIPLIWLMVKIVMKIIPDAKTSEKREPSRPQFLMITDRTTDSCTEPCEKRNYKMQ